MATLLLVGACDLLNCTQADVSGLKIEIFDGEGNSTAFSDTITVTAFGTDSVLLNRSTNTTEIILPLSYHAAEDTFVIRHYGEMYEETETLYVRKTNNTYYESPDCPTVMMHEIEGILCTDIFTDSVRLVNKKVDFVGATNIRLYIR